MVSSVNAKFMAQEKEKKRQTRLAEEKAKEVIVETIIDKTPLIDVETIIEQNGTYNIYFVKERYDILNFRIEHIICEMELIPTNIILLINKAWVNSFYEVESRKKSIVECGWLPYN